MLRLPSSRKVGEKVTETDKECTLKLCVVLSKLVIDIASFNLRVSKPFTLFCDNLDLTRFDLLQVELASLPS